MLQRNTKRFFDLFLLGFANSIAKSFALPNNWLARQLALKNIKPFVTARAFNVFDLLPLMLFLQQLSAEPLKLVRVHLFQSLINRIHTAPRIRSSAGEWNAPILLFRSKACVHGTSTAANH